MVGPVSRNGLSRPRMTTPRVGTGLAGGELTGSGKPDTPCARMHRATVNKFGTPFTRMHGACLIPADTPAACGTPRRFSGTIVGRRCGIVWVCENCDWVMCWLAIASKR